MGSSIYLLKGPFRVLPEDGLLSGMLTCRFLFLFIVILVSVVTKTFATVFITHKFNREFNERAGLPELVFFANDSYSRSVHQRIAFYYIPSISLGFGVMVLPHIIFSIGCLLRVTGVRKQLLSIICGNPQLFLLPVFTHFVIGNGRLHCISGPRQNIHKRRLILSKELTIVNIFINFVSLTVCSGIMSALEHTEDSDKMRVGATFLLVTGLLTLPGILVTSIFLCLGSPCCCPLCTTGCCKVSYQHMEVIHNEQIGKETVILDVRDIQTDDKTKSRGIIQANDRNKNQDSIKKQ